MKKADDNPLHTSLLGFLEHLDQPFYISDPFSYEIIYANASLKHYLGGLNGQKCYTAFHGLDEPCSFCTNALILGDNFGRTYTWKHWNTNLNCCFHCIDQAMYWTDGRIVRTELAIDITDQVRFETMLRKKDKELWETNTRFEELQTTLKVLMEHVQQEENGLQEIVTLAIQKNILSSLTALKNTSLSRKQLQLVHAIEQTVQTVISPFTPEALELKERLTPMERQVAGRIAQGKSTKQICQELGLSRHTINSHRANLRKKLGIAKNSINLKTRLQSLNI